MVPHFAVSSDSYAKAVYKMAPAASPMAAPVAAGGPVPLSTILYSSVPTVSLRSPKGDQLHVSY